MKKYTIRTITIALAIFLSLFGTNVANATNSLYSIVVKTPDSSNVYFVQDGVRHQYPNKLIYNTWFPDFSNIFTIPTVRLRKTTWGVPMLPYPGSYMVKFGNTNNKVYDVVGNETLKEIESSVEAQTLYGDDWMSKIIFLPGYYASYYTVVSK